MARAKVKNPIGPRLRQLRERAGLTQQQLAEAADVADATISRVERGRITSPSMDLAEKLAKALRVPVGELFEPIRSAQSETIRACDRKLLAVVRDLEDAAVEDVTKAVKTLINVGKRGAARR